LENLLVLNAIAIFTQFIHDIIQQFSEPWLFSGGFNEKPRLCKVFSVNSRSSASSEEKERATLNLSTGSGQALEKSKMFCLLTTHH